MSRTTIPDIAKMANVSNATVSRVLNHPDSVKHSTRNKVLQAMTVLGYSIPGTTEEQSGIPIVLVLLPEFSNPFIPEVIEGINASAQKHNMKCIFMNPDKKGYSCDELLHLASSVNARGILLFEKIAAASELEQLNQVIPIVQCSEYFESDHLSYVSVDDYTAGITIMNYLLEKGYRRIALINSSLEYKFSQNREAAYRDALEKAGREVDENLIVHLSELRYNSATLIISKLLDMPNKPDAIFATSDLFAVAAVNAIRKANLRIPEDVGVIGFDNTYIALMSDPPLTTMSQPLHQLGFLSCEILADQIRHPARTPKKILLETELIIRASL